MYIYIYLYTYTYIYIYVFIYIGMYLSIYIYKYKLGSCWQVIHSDTKQVTLQYIIYIYVYVPGYPLHARPKTRPLVARSKRRLSFTSGRWGRRWCRCWQWYIDIYAAICI